MSLTLMDPEDQQFGHKAAEDQDEVDALADKRVTEDELSDEPPQKEPRAGRKADEPHGLAVIRCPWRCSTAALRRSTITRVAG